MEEVVEKIKKNYEENLKPHDYFKLLEEVLPEMEDTYVTCFTALYELMKSGRFKGNKLLEIGSGAVVYNIASASAYFTEIVQSDFVEANCEELRKWLRCESQLDWTPFLKAIAKIEGMEDTDSGVREIEDRIRKSVKAVVRCDVLSDEVIPREVETQYDVIITSFAMECAAPNLEEYAAILKRLNRLLRPGGGLVIISVFNAKSWKTAGGEFHCLDFTPEDADKALDKAGFAQKEWIVLPKKMKSPSYQWDGVFYVASTKI